MKIRKLLVTLILLFSATLFAQSPTNGGFETTPLTPGTDWTTSGGATNSTTNARTGVYSLKHTTSTTATTQAHTNATIISVPNNSYGHVIAWAVGSTANADSSIGGTLNGITNNTGFPGTPYGTTLTRLTYVSSQNTSGGAVNFTSRLRSRSKTATVSTDIYWDDVIMYTSTSNVTDIVQPLAATSFTTGATLSGSISFSWTDGSDAATGIQNTIILRAPSSTAGSPVMNDQGVYSTGGGTSGPNTVSTNWAVISTSVIPGTMTYTDLSAIPGTSYKYAIIHRDLAYNYSAALVSGSITCPSTITSTTTGGLWSVGSTWVGGIAPAPNDNVIIATSATVTLDSNVSRTSGTTTTVNTGATLATGIYTYTNNGSGTTVNGTFRLDNSGSVTGNDLVYDNIGTTSTLVIVTPTTIAGANAAWPSSNSPYNVSVTGGGLTINAGISRTVPGTFLVASTVNLAVTSVLQLNGICQLNGGVNFAGIAPTYGSASTLVYNIGGTPTVGNEWSGNSATPTAGLGTPQNVTIQNSTTLTMPAATRSMAGDLNINTGNFTINASNSFFIAGNWNRASAASFTPNTGKVYFSSSVANTIHTVTVSGGGTETFYTLEIQTTGSLKLAAGINPTNITVTGSGGLTLNTTNASSVIDLNGQTLTLSGGGTLGGGGAGVKNITSSAVTVGTLVISTNPLTISLGSGTLATATNTIVKTQQTLTVGAASLVTINGTLQINSGGSIALYSPIYGSSSLLQYNTTGGYTRTLEWNADAATSTIATTPGYPNNVQISNNTTLTFYNASYLGPKGMNGNFTIDAGSAITFGATTTAGALTVKGNVANAGIITLGVANGDDLVIGGDFSNTGVGTFNGNSRAVYFNKNGTQTVSSATALTIPFLRTSGTTGTTVQLLSDLIISSSSSGVSIITFGNANDVIDITAGKNLTIGSTGNPGAITGAAGTFKGTTTSGLSLLGTGSIGTLSFTTGFQNLGTFTMNRQAATVGCVMGSALTVNTNPVGLVLTNGLIDLGANNLTVASSSGTSGASSNSYVLAYTTTGGQLIKTFSAAGSFTYPIGDNTVGLDYSPCTFTFTGGTYAGTVGVRVVDAAPNGLGTATDYLTRYWQVFVSGVAPTNYTFAGTYGSIATDIVGTETACISGCYTGSTTWTDIGSAIGSNTCTVTGTSFPYATNEFSAKTGTPPPYYRSAVAGSWATASNWQSSTDNVTWITSAYVPDSNATAITIRNLYNITISSGSVTADDITINSGATLTVSGGTFILNDNTSVTYDMQVNGTFTYSGGTFTQNASAGIAFGVSATYNHSFAAATLTLPIATWDVTSTCNVTGFNAGSATSGNSTLAQTFGNFTWNNTNTGYLNIEQNNFKVLGTLTVGPSGSATTNLLSFGNTGTFTNTINRIAVTGGLLNCAGGASVTLAVTNDVSVSGGTFNVSKGSGTAALSIGTDLSVSGIGSFNVINSSTSPSTTLIITRDLLITGTDPTVNLEYTGSASGVATINVGRDFSCTSSGNTYAAVDFGGSVTTSAVAGNVINIVRNFTKSGNCFFQTFSNNSATGFAFTGTTTQSFTYSGTNSNWTSYVVQSGATVQMNSNLTLGTGTAVTPISTFTVSGTLNFQGISSANYNIIGYSTGCGFIANAGSTLITGDTNGLGGTTATGSIQSFGTVGSASSAGRAAFIAGCNFTFNGNTTAPFPVPYSIGNPAIVNVNASITSNVASANITISGIVAGSGALNVNNGGTFILNPTSNNLYLNNGTALNIASGGIFDNNGENFITSSTGTPSINITGKFITRDVQGFVGTNTAIPGITPTINAGSTVEYGLSGDQAVQGGTAPTYQNITFSNSGTKTLSGNNAVVGTITVSGSVIFNASNNQFGSGTSGITMTGTSTYQLFGTSASKPESGGAYSLGINTTFEYTGASQTNIRVSSPVINYANIVISGLAINPATTTGILFQAGGSFSVNNGATFRLANTAGFNGATNTAINSTNNPTIKLFAGSTVDYYGASQTLTSFSTYYNVNVSGTGTKTLFTTPIFMDGDLNVNASTLLVNTSEVIEVGKAVNVNAAATFEIKNNGQLIQVVDTPNGAGAYIGVNTGNIIYNRTATAIKGYDYVYWASPVTGQDVSTIYTSPSPGFKYFWNPTASNINTASTGTSGIWQLASGLMTPTKGYIVRGSSSYGMVATNLPGVFTGVPNNGVISTTISRSGNTTVTQTGASGATVSNYDDNWNLVGNPYPSAIKATEFLKASNNPNIQGFINLWTHGTAPVSTTSPFYDTFAANYTSNDYITYNAAGSSSGPSVFNGYIGAGQGFFVSMNDGAAGSSTVTFNNSMRSRTHANSQFYRTTAEAADENNRIWLDLVDPNNESVRTLVGYFPEATLGLDRMYDAFKNVANDKNIYSLAENTTVIIQGRPLPFDQNDQVPIGVRIMTAGNYKIAIAAVDGLFEHDQPIYLEDKELNLIYDLRQTPYSFTSVAGTFNDRFVLRYTNAALGNPDFTIENNVVIAANHGELTIKSTIENIQEVTVYDVLGRQLFFAKGISNKDFVTSAISTSQQTLIVKIKLDNGVMISRKIIL